MRKYIQENILLDFSTQHVSGIIFHILRFHCQEQLSLRMTLRLLIMIIILSENIVKFSQNYLTKQLLTHMDEHKRKNKQKLPSSGSNYKVQPIIS